MLYLDRKLGTWTLTILSAFNLAIWTGQNTLLINNKTVLAFTDRLVVGHHTLLVQITAETTARAITTSIAASRIIGAIIIAAAAVDD